MALKDYLTHVKNGIQNGDKIIEAMLVAVQVKNNTVSPEALAEILKRKDICEGCPFNSKNYKETHSDYVYSPLQNQDHCVLCKCRLGGDDTKEYCLSCTCGAKAWNEKNPQLAPKEVKWTAFEVTQ